MRILMVEDDTLYRELIGEAMRERFSNLIFDTMSSEGEFHSSLGELAANPPDCVILDVMLPPQRRSKAGDTGAEGEADTPFEFFDAGFRCLRALRSDPRTAEIPVFLLTVVDPEKDARRVGGEVLDDVQVISKQTSAERVADVAEKVIADARRRQGSSSVGGDGRARSKRAEPGKELE